MAPQLERLTRREREVLALLAVGHTNRQVAGLLHISVRTAESHRASLQRKLELRSRSELVRVALANGLVGSDHDRPARLARLDSDPA
jgi:DNA-binding CsgD family transcriptional regulator